MNKQVFPRRGFLGRSLGLTLAGLVGLRLGVARAEPAKVAFPLDKLPALKSVGGAVVVKVKDKLVLLIRDGENSMRALDPICTHMKCVVGYSAAEHKIKCPCHGSQYDLNGNVLHGPAPRPLTTYAAALEGDRVVVTF